MKIYDYSAELSFDDYYETETDILFSNATFNGLLKYSKTDGTVDYVQVFGGEPKRKIALHHKVYCYNNKLFFMPDHSSVIHIYDLNKGSMKELLVGLEKDKKFRGIDSFREGNIVYIFYGYAHNPCVVLDLKTEAIEIIDDVYACLPDEIRSRNTPVFLSSFTKKDDDIYGAVWDSCYVFKYSLSRRQGTVISFQNIIKSLSGLTVDETGVFYFAERGKEEIVSYDTDNDSVVIYESDWLDFAAKEKNGNDLQMIYCNLLSVKGMVLLTPNLGRQILCLDNIQKKVVPYADLPSGFKDIEDSREKWRRFYHVKIMNDVVRLFPCRANMVIDIRVSDRVVNGKQYTLTKEWLQTTYIKEFWMKSLEAKLFKKKVYENETLGLQELLAYIINAKEMVFEEEKREVGNVIWNMVKG